MAALASYSRPMRIALLYVSLLIASLALTVNARGQDEAPGPEPEGDGFKAVRRPVLGVAIEWNEDTKLYRLVSVESERKTLNVGSLEECEDALVEELRSRHGEGRLNLRLRTIGGAQFWSDVFWYSDWRIQEHAYTGHFRLLDPADTRVAWGTREACRTHFESERICRKLQLDSTHLVVLLHGLGRSRQSMDAMRADLTEAGFAVAAVGYPSTRQTIAEHAAGLTQLLNGLDDIERVSFVTHSLGGIVVRATLADDKAQWRQRVELGRVVMLAPPNQGSELARELFAFSPFRVLAGPSAEELTRELEDIPAPPCPFGIVAASRKSEGGLNPFIEGDDDGVVSVAETKLEGAADYLELEGVHTFVMTDRKVIAATVRFLNTGRFAQLDEKSEQQIQDE